MKLFGNMNIKDNELYIGNISSRELVKKFGTPLYVMDEELIRENCRNYYEEFKAKEGINKVAYAGKAFLSIAMCQLINEEGLCLDVVSGGELYTAHKSNFPMEKIYFHGNNKTIEEIEMGVRLGVGRFVVDNFYEIEKINDMCKKYNKVQKILLRVTPGIEAHTHEYIKTGQIDSKFGFTLLKDEVLRATKTVNSFSNIELMGFHCHIGSQIFGIQPYRDEVGIMMNLVKKIKENLDYDIKELDLGGGFGIYYQEGDNPPSSKEFCSAILEEVNKKSQELNIKVPTLTIEPGRSIVGNAGTTLYTVGSMKDIPNIRKYVSVDGGMSDNIRPALYSAEYECIVANKVQDEDKETVTIAGKCCESGDILLNNVEIPKVKSGDILAVLTTGAYGYSMASNYNKIAKAAVVLVKDGEAKLICKRETYEDMISNELEL